MPHATPSEKSKPKPQIQSEPKLPLKEPKQEGVGLEADMKNRPRYEASRYKAADKLKDKKALVTGGDSGIGRAVAVLYAREGADVAITYLPEEKEDAETTGALIEHTGRRCLLIEADLSNEESCTAVVEEVVAKLGGLDILVSNAAHQARKKEISEITYDEWDYTFRTNIYAYFALVKAAVPHLKPGSAIIATSSETAEKAPKELMDYSATKGAINSFTRSLAQNLITKGIRVNAVAPGPVWTPLNVRDPGLPESKVAEHGKNSPIGRPGQPEEIAPAYVFLASDADSSYISGVILPQTGGLPIN